VAAGPSTRALSCDNKMTVKPKLLLIITALLEVGTGLALLAAPSSTVLLLLGVGFESPAAIVVGRVAGAAILSIGVACGLESRSLGVNSKSGLIPGLLIYNAVVPVLLAGASYGAKLHGLGLWPASVAHTAMAIWCVVCLVWA
jgi:hypothetical protein